jgi:hypothetical protein
VLGEKDPELTRIVEDADDQVSPDQRQVTATT